MAKPVCLVCEDEALIALDLETCLADAGLAVAGPFAAADEALRWIETRKAPDIALLDFRLGDTVCMPLVHALRERGVPIVFQSGLPRDAVDLPPEVRDLPWLSKPVSYRALMRAVVDAVPALSRRRSRRSSGSAQDEVRARPAIISRGRSLTHFLTRRLAALHPLGETERERLEAAVARTFKTDGGHDIARAGEQSTDCHVLLSGMAAPYRLLPDGSRQIMRFCFPGDLADLDGFVGGKMDHSVAALGSCTVGVIPHGVLRDLIREHSAIAQALWRHTLADAAVFREWVVNVGRRSALERIAHIICEVWTRLRDAGLAIEISGKQTFLWPLTQQDIADATGLSTVHVNRSLQQLRGSGWIELSRDKVTILDWNSLNNTGGFEPGYLFPVLPGGEGAAHFQM